MKQEVHKFINRHQLISPNETIIVAVSGGPDSMALLEFLWSERERYHIKVCVCHVHHQLRGSEADEDAKYVQAYCEGKNIPFYQKRVQVKEYAAKQQIGTQLAARELRYEWFSELLSTIPNSKIATGHHGDDQVETMLMKMIRGSMPLHSFGIPAKRELGFGLIIRPFLSITKEEIEQYCKEASIYPRYDSSNQSQTYTRNRVRQDILPILKRENGNIHIHMQRQNEWADDDHDFLMSLAGEVLPTIIIEKSERNVTISRQALLNVVVPLQRRLIHLILSYLYGKNSPLTTSIHIEQVLELFNREKPSGELHLSDSVFVRRDYDVCHFSDALMKTIKEREHVLSIPGRIFTSNWTMEASLTDNNEVTEAQNQVVLDLDAITEPLIVRSRRPSDRIACRGMEGTKKVGRLFIDRKIVKHEREQWPILVDGNGQILWVPFLHRTRLANVGPQTKNKLVVTCYRQEKSGPNTGSDSIIGGFFNID
ncbi:tRNA lysidine(34) synthetase TilS [Halalkalibacter nanhaiisediminis]|uniref:tRNA(Ile)-lysidine synthase n=1 Tax=Halalkalibacter nanhaiisediminis TaxID=688079 RepID=A0A562Q8W2_9BACI|nr:tRNA lysidine(34) synthetase TilS [Halalkalibacter nanhaiisediminis]TWI53211.1 tRNA(Ile)-lysidine synthase [Halalkalibacter nanhaiisediminis]